MRDRKEQSSEFNSGDEGGESSRATLGLSGCQEGSKQGFALMQGCHWRVNIKEYRGGGIVCGGARVGKISMERVPSLSLVRHGGAHL